MKEKAEEQTVPEKLKENFRIEKKKDKKVHVDNYKDRIVKEVWRDQVNDHVNGVFYGLFALEVNRRIQAYENNMSFDNIIEAWLSKTELAHFNKAQLDGTSSAMVLMTEPREPIQHFIKTVVKTTIEKEEEEDEDNKG